MLPPLLAREPRVLEERNLTTQVDLTRKDCLLLFVYLAKEIRGRTRLQKEIYLCEEESGANIQYSFTPYDYGPFSIELWNDLEELCTGGFVWEGEMPFVLEDRTGVRYIYRVTDKGTKEVEGRILPRADKELVRKMKETIEKYNEKDLMSILRTVYRHFSSEVRRF